MRFIEARYNFAMLHYDVDGVVNSFLGGGSLMWPGAGRGQVGWGELSQRHLFPGLGVDEMKDDGVSGQEFS